MLKLEDKIFTLALKIDTNEPPKPEGPYYQIIHCYNKACHVKIHQAFSQSIFYT